jgi:hypothetical protein
LKTQIEAIESKAKPTDADLRKLESLQKELEPIQNFLNDAKQQRDAILAEIGKYRSFPLALAFAYKQESLLPILRPALLF